MTKHQLILASEELESLIVGAKELAMKIQDAAPALSRFEVGSSDEVESCLSQALDCCEHMTGNIKYSLTESLGRK